MVGAALTIALVGLGALGAAAPSRTLKDRQIIGTPTGGFSWGPQPTTTCIADVPVQDQPPCLISPIGGGVVISPPPPKQKRFWLPDGWSSDIKKAIDTLEARVVALQNKKNKTKADYAEIEDLYAALEYLAGVTYISAPPGVGTIFHPGKRSAAGAYASVCPGLEGAELALEKLLQKDHKTAQELVIEQKLKSFLLGCGITIVKSPDGTTTILKPSDKRSAAITFDVAGVQEAYRLLQQSLGSSQPSFVTWLIEEHLVSILRLSGAAPARRATVTKRQTFTIGDSTCELSNVLNFEAILEALLEAYGDPRKAPQNIQLLEQIIVTTLRICGRKPSWTGPIVPDPTVPGGPIVPDPTIPGGPIVPDPTVPGGEIHPSDKRQTIVTNPAALLAALAELEKAYGHYGSGTIPTSIFLIMQNIVTVLQAGGVTVPGWPILTGPLVPGN